MEEKKSLVRSRFLVPCDNMDETVAVEPFTMVIFGGKSDLAQRMLLPTLYHLFCEGMLPRDFSIIGFGSHSPLNDDAYRAMMHKAVSQHSGDTVDENSWRQFAAKLHFLDLLFEQEQNYAVLCEKIDALSSPMDKGKIHVIYYLAAFPELLPVIVDNLKKKGLCKGRYDVKVVVEKPFGTDLASAQKLNDQLLEAFDEQQIYRIDHYLGKETVQNILFVRFANSIFEPLWNNRYVDNVQITVAESIGIGARGRFYESSGVIRDIVQNHMMQLIGFIAMEPPVGFAADFVRDEKIKVFHAVRPVNAEYIEHTMVRGQYGKGTIDGNDVAGYRQEQDVAPGSSTATFFAGKFYIDNWRWAGVPFFVRTGKRLARRITEICIEFKQPPLELLGRMCDELGPNRLFLTVQPEEKIALQFSVKNPASTHRPHTVHMNFQYKDAFSARGHPPYERLLLDCMKGDLTLFIRQDGAEAAWAVVDPIIEYWQNHPAADFPNYPAGSWGPAEADELLTREGKSWCTA